MAYIFHIYPVNTPRSIYISPITMMRTMVDHAMAWAVSRGLQRRNPVHGQDEYKVATDFNFANRGKDRLTTRASSSAELEARPGCGLGC